MLTKDNIEKLRKLAESRDFGGLPIPQLCDLAILGILTRDVWYAEYFQTSAKLNQQARKDFYEAKEKWLNDALPEDRKTLEARGLVYEGRYQT